MRAALHQFFQFSVRDMARDAVAAQQETRPRIERRDLEVSFDFGFCTECAVDDIAARMTRGLRSAERAGAHRFGDFAVIFSLAEKLMPIEAVHAAVAHVPDDRPRAVY